MSGNYIFAGYGTEERVLLGWSSGTFLYQKLFFLHLTSSVGICGALHLRLYALFWIYMGKLQYVIIIGAERIAGIRGTNPDNIHVDMRFTSCEHGVA